jgi:hypothetical protein
MALGGLVTRRAHLDILLFGRRLRGGRLDLLHARKAEVDQSQAMVGQSSETWTSLVPDPLADRSC